MDPRDKRGTRFGGSLGRFLGAGGSARGRGGAWSRLRCGWPALRWPLSGLTPRGTGSTTTTAAAAATAEPPAAAEPLATRTSLDPNDFLTCAREARLEWHVPGSLVADRDVVDFLLALHLAPAGGQETSVPAGGALAQLVGVRSPQVETLDSDFLVVGHAAKGSRRIVPTWWP